MSEIFISYARADVDFARRLATALEQAGAKVWLDVKDIPLGANWSSAIQEGLDRATLMILILTPESGNSENVANEWQYYFDEKKPIIPVRLQPVEKLHFQLRRIQWVDFHEQSFETGFQRLHDELTRNGFALKSDTPVNASPSTEEKPPSANLFNFRRKPDSVSRLAQYAAFVENFLLALGINLPQARLATESGYGWAFRRGSAIIEVYVTEQEGGDGYLQVLSPIIHLPTEELRPPLYRRLLELNLQLTGAALGIYLDDVYVYVERPLDGLDMLEANQLIMRVSSYADDLDSRLVNEFGGRLYGANPPDTD